MSYTPNYQGVFLRGLGGQYSDHYGATLHQSAGLGEIQGDAIRNIYGSLPVNDNGNFPDPTGAFYYLDTYLYGPEDLDDRAGGRYGFSAANVVPTANENRPINKAVRYLIRAA